ncbi:hypothetical protein [Rosistilla oblonga]|uniref:hypothetical protein n=1 Tax=Rosistilla oblonga TaxID=2527990 RepID=UPI003A96BCD1
MDIYQLTDAMRLQSSTDPLLKANPMPQTGGRLPFPFLRRFASHAASLGDAIAKEMVSGRPR